MNSLIAAVGVILAAAIALAPARVVAEPDNRGDEQGKLGPGCAPDRPAIAHRAGGVMANADKSEKAPIPCTSSTGFRTSEISLVVTNEGTLLFQPAVPKTGLPIGVLRSVDQGATWDFIDPNGNPPRNFDEDMNMWSDPQTGRVFWTGALEPHVGQVFPPRVDHSDDDGQTWVASSTLPGIRFDKTQIFTGPPPKSLKHLMQGYPNVVYVFVSGGFSCGLYNFCGAHIAKSVDGGATFGPAVALPYPPECPAPGTDPRGGYASNGVVGRDGTVYVPFTPCERPYIAISHDEGDTWQLSLVADTETIGWGELGVGIDKQGNLYATWTGAADRLPYLAISRDGELHWGTPLMIAAPGVNEAALPQLVAGARGQVAVAYLGSRNAPVPFPPNCITGAHFFGTAKILNVAPSLSCPGYEHETWNTYITETWNAVDRHPLFWSTTLNDPAEPTWYGATPMSMRVAGGFAGGHRSSAGDGVDYIAATMSPDNTAWVGFVQECPFGVPVAGNPNCPTTLTGAATDGYFGMVGRLVWVDGGAENDDP